MFKIRLLAGGAAGFVMASAAVALAIPMMFHSHRASSDELAASTAGAGSLGSAIAAAERSTGGRVMEIHYEPGNGGYYDATVSRNGAAQHAMINLKTRQVAVIDQANAPARTFDFRERAGEEMVVRSSKVGIADAVADAEQASRGVAIAARTTHSQDGNMVGHDVETVKGDMVRPVLIDAKTGLVIGDRQAFLSP